MTKYLLTMQYNESLLLPVFLAHYSKYFSSHEIFVIDHGSDEPMPIGADELYNRIRVPRNRAFSEASRMRLISHLASGLLQYFDAGVYVDCDEFISLDDFDERDLAHSPVIHVAGFDVFQQATPDGDRLYGLFNPAECKPLIFRSIPDWGLGFHGCSHPPGRLKLPLAHARYLYKEESAQRLRQRVAVHARMNDEERNRGIDGHWAQGDAEYRSFERKVAQSQGAGTQPGKFEPIDPTPFFAARVLQNPAVAAARTFFAPTAARAAASVVDLTDHFRHLIWRGLVRVTLVFHAWEELSWSTLLIA